MARMALRAKIFFMNYNSSNLYWSCQKQFDTNQSAFYKVAARLSKEFPKTPFPFFEEFPRFASK